VNLFGFWEFPDIPGVHIFEFMRFFALRLGECPGAIQTSVFLKENLPLLLMFTVNYLADNNLFENVDVLIAQNSNE